MSFRCGIPERLRNSKALPVLAAIPIAAVAVVLADLLLLPRQVLCGGFRAAGCLALLGVEALGKCLLAPLLFQFTLAAVLLIAPGPGAGARRFRVVAFLAACVGVSLRCYGELAEYEAFAGYAPFVAFFVLLAAGLWLWLLTVEYGISRFRSPRGRALLRFGIPAAFLCATVVAHFMNVEIYPDAYPTLHLAALQVTSLFLHAGIAAALVALDRPSGIPIALPLGGLLALLAAGVVSTGAAGGGWCQREKPPFRRHTILGRSLSILKDGAAPDIRRWQEWGGKVLPFRDPDGAGTFRALGGMPGLPDDFRLTDHNVLLISMEATRFDETSFADPASAATPMLRRFAEDGGFLFERAYTPSSYTVQVFSSIFSMTYPSMTHIRIAQRPWLGKLLDRVVTVPELFAEAGYHTFWVGHSLRLDGVKQGFASKTRVVSKFTQPDIDEQIVDEAIARIDEAAAGPRRFFGWVFLVSPHNPYLEHYPGMPGRTDLDRYRQELRYGDSQIGRLLRHMQESGLAEKTVIVFHGDHGEEFKEHGGSYHRNVYSEVTHVPLIVRIPPLAGGVVSRPVSLMYLFPWLLLHGTEPMARAASERLDREIGPVLQLTEGGVVTEMLKLDSSRVSLVYPDHRVVYDSASDYYELYDLSRDAAEWDNIVDGDPEAAKLFGGRMQRYLQFRQMTSNTEYSRTEDGPGKKPAKKGAAKKKPPRKKPAKGQPTPTRPRRADRVRPSGG